MKEKIKEYVENNTKGFELEGVEFCDEMMQGVRDCLDEGLEDTDIEAE